MKDNIPVCVKKAAWDACNEMWLAQFEPEIITIKFGIEVVKYLGPKLMGWRQDEDLFGIPYEFPEDPYSDKYLVAVWARKPEEAFCLRVVHLKEIEWENNVSFVKMTTEDIMKSGPYFPDRAIMWDYLHGFKEIKTPAEKVSND